MTDPFRRRAARIACTSLCATLLLPLAAEAQAAPAQASPAQAAQSSPAHLPAQLATGMRSARKATEKAQLEPLLGSALVVRDTGFFYAALEVASDQQATVQARTAAVLAASMMLADKTTFDYDAIVVSTEVAPCELKAYDKPLAMLTGVALPETAIGRLNALADDLLANANTPKPVANAARCARRVVEKAR